MLTVNDFHPYQRRAVNHQVQHPNSMLWLFTGAGKTVITETTFDWLQRHGNVRAALVIGPKRVTETVWDEEAVKWAHLKHLRFSRIIGSPDRRMAALFKPADIYLVNYENIPWLVAQLQAYFIDQGHPLPFDMLVIDEISALKNSEGVRFQALEQLLPYFTVRTGLTGTPASNGLIDLHGQYKAIDLGQRLGYNVTDYRSNWFTKAGYGGYSYEPAPGAKDAIHQAVADITLQMDRRDYLSMPDMLSFDITVQMPPKARKAYDEMERLMFASFNEDDYVEAESEVGKMGKLLQMANGAVYTDTETKAWAPLHDAKLDGLNTLVEEAQGEPVLVGYNYRTDAARILKRFPYAVDLTPLSDKAFRKAKNDFANGRLRMVIGHPGSMAHGVDGLQAGSHIIGWFGCPWSLERYIQLNSRLDRQGQASAEPVRCYRIRTADTVDDAVLLKLAMKADTQDELKAAVKAYRETRGM